MNKLSIEYNKVYCKHIKNISFGPLNKKEVRKLLKNGSNVSPFLELCIIKWFKYLRFVDESGYDYFHIRNCTKWYDAKCFTKSGANFAPSYMIGGNRQFQKRKAHSHTRKVVYILCDITSFPLVKIVFIKGSELIKRFPNCKISPKHQKEIFG